MTPTEPTYTYHTDPGHGWIEVPIVDLVVLGLQTRISGYSYTDGQSIYLEEDRDAALWVDEYHRRHGHAPKIAERYSADTFVRNLPHVPNR